MPMPTVPGVPPETWEQLLQLIAQLNTSIVELGEQGITTFEQLQQWLATQGYDLVPIYEDVPTVVNYTISKTTAVDPTTTTAVANRVATDVVATGGAGTAVTQFVTGGNRTLGLVPKIVAVGACLSMLVSLIGAGLVSDENQEDLITSVDPYTIDGENVPVLIDENGKTHFLEEMVEAIRTKAIELGIFDSEESYTIDWSQVPSAPTLTVDLPVYPYINDAMLGTKWTTYTGNLSYGRYFISDNEITAYTGDKDIYLYNLQTDYRQDPRGTLLFLSEGSFSVTISSHRTTYNSDGSVYQERDLTDTINGVGWTTPSWGDFTGLYRNNYQIAWSNEHANPPTIKFTYCDGSSASEGGQPTSNEWAELIYIAKHGTIQQDGGVEGITPASDLIAAGIKDTSIPLTQVLPQLAQGQMSIASPNENDLTHKSNWYQVSINSEDVFTDGATEEETSTATDGDVKEDLQPAILDAINELIKQLNPDGTPDIPVSDSGDTPPENPPLTPSAGANGSNGLWAIYNPTLTQVQEFGAWLWSDSLADQFKRIFNSPIDGVIGFHMLYCTPSRGADQTIKCGFLASPVTSRTVASPYVEIDCGTVSIGEFYRNALDYDYTRISVYLPFIGIVPLDTNIVMGSDLNITYRVDVLTGTCLAQIKVIKENSDAVMYAFDGNCAVQIPLTATTYTGMVGALMSGVSAGIGVMTGNIAQAVTSGANALANMISGKSGVKQSGTMGANAGALGIRKPYVIITHPIAYMPVNFNKLEGLPSNITATLGTLTGFTRVRSVHLENIGTATQEEINMIEELLKEGVII